MSIIREIMQIMCSVRYIAEFKLFFFKWNFITNLKNNWDTDFF